MALTETTRSDELLDPAFMNKLDQLSFVSRKIFAGKMRGERLSKRRGESVEFADYRNYVVGDDLRFLDWNVYARLEKLFLKLFLQEEDLHVNVLIDVSKSMDWGDPNKALYARRAVIVSQTDAIVKRPNDPARHNVLTRRMLRAVAGQASFVAVTSVSRNVVASCENGMMLNRSFGLRLARQNRRALRACSIFSPAMLPEVSMTKAMSLGSTSALFTDAGGAMRTRKKPSSPTGRCVSTVRPNSLSLST